MSDMVSPSLAQPRRTRRRWIVGGLAAAILLGLLGYFLLGPPVQTAILRAQLSTEIPASRTAAVTPADTAHAAWLEQVSAALGMSRPVYSASYDVCYEDSDGELAENYNLKCQVSYVDFYVLPARNGAVETAIEEARTSQFGPQSSAMVFVPNFLVDQNGNEAELPEDLPDTIWASMPGTSDARAASDQWTIAFSVPAYAAHDAFQARTLLSEHGQTALDPTRQYIVITDARPYFAKALGCAIGLHLFCTSPLAD